MSTWIALAGVGIVTFLARASFIVFADPAKFPRAFRAALVFVPPSVLAAITVPGLMSPEGALDLSLGNPRWIAGLVALAIAVRTGNTLATIAAGMATLWLLRLW